MLNLLEYVPDREVAQTEEDVLRLESGEVIRLETGPQGQRVRIVSPSGELLLEYDPRSRETRVTIPEGDLKLAAPRGNIDLDAGGRVRLKGKEVELTTDNLGVEGQSRVSLRPGQLRLSSALVGLVAGRGELLLERATYAGQQFRGTVERAKVIAGRLDTVADTVVSRAKSIYGSVENLLQTRARRLRTLVETDSQLTAQTIYERAKDDVVIDGKQILLG